MKLVFDLGLILVSVLPLNKLHSVWVDSGHMVHIRTDRGLPELVGSAVWSSPCQASSTLSCCAGVCQQIPGPPQHVSW